MGFLGRFSDELARPICGRALLVGPGARSVTLRTSALRRSGSSLGQYADERSRSVRELFADEPSLSFRGRAPSITSGTSASSVASGTRSVKPQVAAPVWRNVLAPFGDDNMRIGGATFAFAPMPGATASSVVAAAMEAPVDDWEAAFAAALDGRGDRAFADDVGTFAFDLENGPLWRACLADGGPRARAGTRRLRDVASGAPGAPVVSATFGGELDPALEDRLSIVFAALACWCRPLEGTRAMLGPSVTFRTRTRPGRRRDEDRLSILFAALACWRRPLEGTSFDSFCRVDLEGTNYAGTDVRTGRVALLAFDHAISDQPSAAGREPTVAVP